MLDIRIDQATGLRKLFRTPSVRVLPILAGGPVGHQIVALAEHFTECGERVLIIDQAQREIAQACRMVPDGTLADLLRGDADFNEVSPFTEAGFRIMQAGAGYEVASERGIDVARIYSAFSGLPEPVDLVLVHVAHVHRLARVVDRAGDVLLFADPSETAVAAAYQNLKVAVQAGRAVHVVIDSVSTEEIATRTYRRIAATSERFLGVVPRYAGWVAAQSIASESAAKREHADGKKPLAQLARQILQWHLAEYPPAGQPMMESMEINGASGD